MQENRFNDLIAYFEKIAREHVLIQHSVTSRKFFRFELDEVLSGMTGAKINFPCLIMEGYRFGFRDEKSDNPQKQRSGAFILADHVKDFGDYDRISEVYDTLESIGDDIIARIKQDKRNLNEPVRNFNISSVEGSLIATEFGNLHGIRFTFELSSKFTFDVDPDRWVQPDPEP